MVDERPGALSSQARNPLECIARFAGEVTANAQGQLARLLRLPPAHVPSQSSRGNQAHSRAERLEAHTLASPSQHSGDGTKAELHDSFSSGHALQSSQVQAGQQSAPHGVASGTEVAGREELGRATWTLLHVLAAQFPDKPSRQQQKDAKTLVCCPLEILVGD